MNLAETLGLSPRPYRILTIDGGGVRGIIPVLWIDRLERYLNGPVHAHCDLIAGTSVGAPSQVVIRVHDTDRYGRQIGEILTADGVSLNLAMVSAGQAAVYPRYCQDPRLFAAERAARSVGLGIWSSAGDQQRPWDHRRRSR